MASRVWAVLALAALFSGLFGVQASVAGTTSPLRTRTQTISSTGMPRGTAIATWRLSPPYLRLQVSTGQLDPGKCVTVYFDWSSSGHHDARALRDCRSNDTLAYTFTEPTPTNITGDPHKLGVCYGLNNHHGTCVASVGTRLVDMNWATWPDPSRSEPCDLSWVTRTAAGTIVKFLDPDPQSAALRAGRC